VFLCEKIKFLKAWPRRNIDPGGRSVNEGRGRSGWGEKHSQNENCVRSREEDSEWEKNKM
jgi:hypothetical protein